MCVWAPKSYHELNESTQFAYSLGKTVRRQDLRTYLTKSIQKRMASGSCQDHP